MKNKEITMNKDFKECFLNIAKDSQPADHNEIVREYERVMKEFRENNKKCEIANRREIIESLTNDELKLIVDLYMQEILSIYEKDHSAKVDIKVYDNEK